MKNKIAITSDHGEFRVLKKGRDHIEEIEVLPEGIFRTVRIVESQLGLEMSGKKLKKVLNPPFSGM